LKKKQNKYTYIKVTGFNIIFLAYTAIKSNFTV